MKIQTIRLCGFQSFGMSPTTIDLTDMTYVLGPNGSGKTAVLEALSRMFSPVRTQRKIRRSDFHVPADSTLDDSQDELPTLWIETVITFSEADDESPHPSVAAFFNHMSITTADGPPQVRIRLTAKLAQDGEVDETIEYVHSTDDADEPLTTSPMSRYDRGFIEVHYLPARRDPADHTVYTTTSLIGRTLRAADWSVERQNVTDLNEQISKLLGSNGAISGLGIHLGNQWGSLHNGKFLKDPSISFGSAELESVFRQLTITFSPTHDGIPMPLDRLSDGQKSLLYISVVMSWQMLARKVLEGTEKSLDPDKLRPPVHTVIALEEPENSLAPHYLGRIVRQLRELGESGVAQTLIATHAPTMLRRVDPQDIRFLRLNEMRETTVRRIQLPTKDDDASKYVREAVEAYPELYFSRLVILGEGASEQVVLPRVLSASGIAEDDASVVVVPLGGRHVNHFWRLLNDLEIPHVTLLDLDSARHQGGWGRVRNAMQQIEKVSPGSVKPEGLEKLPKWDDDVDFPKYNDPKWAAHPNNGPIDWLEARGVFFSSPVDLDLAMLRSFPIQYAVQEVEPDDKVFDNVLGKSHIHENRLGPEYLKLLQSHGDKFKYKSKPTVHLTALSKLEDDELIKNLPQFLSRLITKVDTMLKVLPE